MENTKIKEKDEQPKKSYYERNKETLAPRLRNNSKLYYESHKEEISKKRSEWYQNNKEKVKINNYNRYHKINESNNKNIVENYFQIV